jgi:8-oxo-dGTP diphosphatase
MNRTHDTTPPQHEPYLVGVKGVLLRRGRVLLVRRTDKQQWELPGGRLETGETIDARLRREFREEVGIRRIAVGELLSAAPSNFRIGSLGLMILVYRVYAPSAVVRSLSDEHDAVRWVTLADLDGMSVAATMRAAVLSQLAYYGEG